MSNVVNVYHKSRDVIYEIKFPAGSEDTWQFDVEGDGEIYSVETDNISSYSIDGNSISLPFSITNGNSYSISIIRNNTANDATITFKARRAVDKIFTKIVPNYNVGDGRYLYALNANGDTVYKLDTGLLSGTNYLGSGSFTISPIIATITLPTLPNSTKWGRMCYIVENGIGKILLLSYNNGSIGSAGNYYFSKILPSGDVYNLNEDTLNGYSTYTNIAIINISFYKIRYDYINNNVFFVSYYGRKMSLSDYSVERFGEDPRTYVFATNASIWFNPATEEFSRLYDFNYYNSTIENKRLFSSSSDQCFYSLSTNTYFHNVNNSPRDVVQLDRFGNRIKRWRIGDYPGTTSYKMIGSDTLKNVITASNQSSTAISLIDYDTTTGYALEGTFNLRNTFTDWTDIGVSNYSGLFFLLDYASSDASRIRLHSFNENGEVSYFDFSENIVELCTNQLLV